MNNIVYSIFYCTLNSDSNFVGYCMTRKSFIKEMIKWRQGVMYGQWRIHEKDFLRIKVLVPSLPEQQKHLLDAVYDQFLLLYEKHKADHTKPYPHILSLLNTLKQKKMKMAIVSNKIDSAVKELCIPLFGEYLSVMLGETPTRLKKPNPDMVYEALKQLQVDKDQALFVGDSETDVLTAKNANMRVCGVSWGFRGKDVLKQLNVDFLIDEPMELLNIIEKENQK